MQTETENWPLAVVEQNREWFYKSHRSTASTSTAADRPFGVVNFPGEMVDDEQERRKLDREIHKASKLPATGPIRIGLMDPTLKKDHSAGWKTTRTESCPPKRSGPLQPKAGSSTARKSLTAKDAEEATRTSSSPKATRSTCSPRRTSSPT